MPPGGPPRSRLRTRPVRRASKRVPRSLGPPGRWPGASKKSPPSSPRGWPTGRSRSGCSCPRRRSRTTCPACSPSSAWNGAPRPPCSPRNCSARP